MGWSSVGSSSVGWSSVGWSSVVMDQRSAGREPPSAIPAVRVTRLSFSQRVRILGAVDLPIPAAVDRAVAVLPGLFRSACHSFSSVSVRGFAGSVAGAGTARRVRLVDMTTSQW
ncbi:hypothetical protein [Alloactinosynnema sp. L-07]|uniref:hypothetical protein n=1 Tax=Alloactinosynnema sp. L-07 TaxID=1653480 RepID=UPI0012F9FC7D|nr:hypothetical protein [Alloactinosynnema sp. L-07]